MFFHKQIYKESYQSRFCVLYDMPIVHHLVSSTNLFLLLPRSSLRYPSIACSKFPLVHLFGVISRGHSMFNSQFLQAFTKVLSREVCSSIAYQDSRDAISREDYRFNHVCGLLRWCLPTRHSFNPLRNIVHHHQYMLKSMWVHKWSHEINSPDIK